MILVTGATGHIGNVLVRKLVEKGEPVRVLVLPDENCTPLKGLDLDLVAGDVLDFESLIKACRGVEVIYHLAGVISIMPGENEWVQRVNLEGTRNVLQAAKISSVRRLVYTSSIHAIARVPHGIKIDESIPYDPDNALSAYDRSKAQASLEVLRAIQEGLDAVIVCPTGVIGPFDFRRSEMGHIIFNGMQRKVQFGIDGAYDFVDVRDVAQGLILACEKGRKGENYILSGERITINQLIETTQELVGFRPRFIHLPIWLARFLAGLAPLYYRLSRSKPLFTPYALATVTSNSDISSAKAQHEFGYRTRPARETIADAVQWFAENRHLWLPNGTVA